MWKSLLIGIKMLRLKYSKSTRKAHMMTTEFNAIYLYNSFHEFIQKRSSLTGSTRNSIVQLCNEGYKDKSYKQQKAQLLGQHLLSWTPKSSVSQDSCKENHVMSNACYQTVHTYGLSTKSSNCSLKSDCKPFSDI